MTAVRYERLLRWLRAGRFRCKAAQLLTKHLPTLFMIGYSVTAAVLFFGRDDRLLRFLLVPALALGSCLVLRRLIDRRRPYEVYGFQPLIARDKKGQSLPSNHTVSAVVIALAFWYLSPAGAWVLIPAALVAVSRVAAGVHWLGDVLAGAALAIVAGWLGFWVI